MHARHATPSFLSALFACLLIAAPALATPAGWLGEGDNRTPWYDIRADQPGPTVLIVGGIHGNEPAGAEAADQIRHWPIAKGRLVVIPRAAPTALEANTRRIPGKPRAEGDLNRNFPRTRTGTGTDSDELSTVGPTAEALWAFVTELQPDWILDLHEGFDFNARNSNSVGSSVIHPSARGTAPYAQAMLDAVNAEVTDEEKIFQNLGRNGPINGSLARATIFHLGAKGAILETTWRDQPMPLRARQHRLMVHALLTELGMATGHPHTVFPDHNHAANNNAEGEAQLPIRIALYHDSGAGDGGVRNLTRIVEAMPDAHLRIVNAADIQGGALNRADAVIFTGGRGGAQGTALGDEGRAAVRALVDNGGGYLGICAGAYLATCRLDQYLRIMNSYHIQPWQTGTGQVTVELTPEGRELFGDLPPTAMRYANGPLLGHEEGRTPGLDLPEFRTLAIFKVPVEKNDNPQDHMIGMPAIATADYGQGRVLIISPHPESNPDLDWMLQRSIRWTVRRNETPQPDHEDAEAVQAVSSRTASPRRRRASSAAHPARARRSLPSAL
ncbi:MAG: succinylglutamate desuccinylase/aspartoacylase family protein [Phycisphaerales bacterium]|nr:succinylglutamate desuccinylase/aspartoacylase family protein [Phycisphaerales bacterium]